MTQVTVQPGGSCGWHSHPGGAIIIVEDGALTVYSPVGHRCRTTSYGPGQAFIERPGEVDDVFNNGTVPYVLYVTFPLANPLFSRRSHSPGRAWNGVTFDDPHYGEVFGTEQRWLDVDHLQRTRA